MKRLPPIDAFYWLMIVSANTIGESGGDLISMTLHLGYGASTAVLIGLFALAAGVAIALRSQRPAAYWPAIILSSTAGTTLSDLVTRTWFGTEEHAAYGLGTAAICATLAVIFVAWRLVQPRQALDAPLSRPAESLYWAAILASSTLGTAFGDFISNGTPLGFGGGTAVLFACLAAIGAIAMFTPAPRPLCYWAAIVVAHPLGATLGDLLTKGEGRGFGLGNAKATAILVAIFLAICLAAWLWHPRRLRDEPAAAEAAAAP